MNNLSKTEELYLKAKDAYYNKQPIMSDSEFDELENKLKSLNSNIINKVGAFDRYAKIKHPSLMKSLEKIQADKETGQPPIIQFENWINCIERNLLSEDKLLKFEIEPKLDGNAINLVYENGKLIHALSRGDGKLGRDYISKLDESAIPFNLPISLSKGLIEIRCEAVINKSIFKEKYSNKFSNERNYVAGVLNADNPSKIELSEIDIIPVEIKIHDNGKYYYQSYDIISNLGFKNTILDKWRTCIINTRDMKSTENQFNELFYSYQKFKDDFKYRIDGMVFKLNGAENRNIIGEVEHHPKWAIAVKFKPEDCVTEIIGFEMAMGKTGNFTPVALLKPVDLDGSIVSKASAYNYDFISKNSLNVGSLVTLVKSGDIIPQIINVVSKSDTPYKMTSICPYCGSKLEIVNGKHIHCPNYNCMGKSLMKFINSFNVINLYGIGESFITDLFYKVNDNAKWYFTTNIDIVKNTVISKIGDGKIVMNFIEKLSLTKELTIEQAIAFLSYDGISENGKTALQIAKKLSNISYSFSGLEKKVVSGWNEGETKYNELYSFIDKLNNNGIHIKFLTESKANEIKLCLTGSPKEYGYKTKAEYINKLKSLGYNAIEVNVKDCDYLITDDINSNSAKTKTAKKLNKNIKTYKILDYGKIFN